MKLDKRNPDWNLDMGKSLTVTKMTFTYDPENRDMVIKLWDGDKLQRETLLPFMPKVGSPKYKECHNAL